MRNSKWWWLIVLVTLVTGNLLWHAHDWSEIINPSSTVEVGTDWAMAEFNAESVYQQIINGRNPFVFRAQQVYPYTLQIALSDPGVSNMLFYYPLRQVFNPTQVVRLILVGSSWLASYLMYLLLNKVKVRKEIALGLALIYAYVAIAPFRYLGHYTYAAVYLFPAGALLISKIGETKSKIGLIGWAGLGGAFCAFTLLLNFYYFVGIGIALGIAGGYVVWARKLNWQTIKKMFVVSVIAIITSAVLLFPWIMAVQKSLIVEARVPASGFAGANELSADLLGFVLPTTQHAWYQLVSSFFANRFPEYGVGQKLITENTNHSVYLGIGLLGLIGSCFLRRKELDKKTREQMILYGGEALLLGALLLGPFLKIAGRIGINLEGVSAVLPLPFVILHYFPGMESLRAPTRFFPMVLFFVIICLGIAITTWINKRGGQSWHKWAVAILALVIVEHFTLPVKQQRELIPRDFYQEIATDTNEGTVWEIPFTVRDGFTYLGSKDAIAFQNGSLVYDKPVLGGYFARLHPDVFSYYQELYFVGKVLKRLDNQTIDWAKIDILKAKNELAFLNVRYIILREAEGYTAEIEHVLLQLGAEKIRQAQGYGLYKITRRETSNAGMALGKADDYLYIAQGLGPREDGYRAIVQEKAKLFIKTVGGSERVAISAAADKPRKMRIFFEEQLLGEVEVTTKKQTFEWKTLPTEEGIKTITMVMMSIGEGERLDSQHSIRIYGVEE